MKKNTISKITLSLIPILIFMAYISNSHAIGAIYLYYYDNYNYFYADEYLKIYNSQSLKVEFNPNQGNVLIRGVRYKYVSIGSGPFSVDIRFRGDSDNVLMTDSSIPADYYETWRESFCAGPDYLINDVVDVEFASSHPVDNCILLCAEMPNLAHSYYDVGGGWVEDLTYEYLVGLIYELIPSFELGETKSGEFKSNDNIDAYHVNLKKDNNYTLVWIKFQELEIV